MNENTHGNSEIMRLEKKYNLIGFMRNFKSPPHIAELTAKLCIAQGLTLVYMRPGDVDMEGHKINGKVYVNSKWKDAIVDIPIFIDISPYCFKRKNREVIQYLTESTNLSDERTLNFGKAKLQRFLQQTDAFQHLVIPTSKAKSLKDVEKFVDQYGSIVMKPLGGERGRGIYILNKESEGKYQLGYQKEEQILSHHELSQFFTDEIENKKYILQKYIQSSTIQGDPFDCRIHMEKSGEGKWKNAKNFIRIGIGQKVISNVNQGGGISDIKPFLEANFGDQWETIHQNILDIANTLPYLLEEFRGCKMMTMGMDMGIDKDGGLYLFEVNSAPTTQPLRDIAVTLRVDYYAYMLNKYSRAKPLDFHEVVSELEENNKSLTKENQRLKEDSNKMKNSMSWKITRPIRGVGKIIKRLR